MSVAELKSELEQLADARAELAEEYEQAEEALRQALLAETPRTAEDYRLRIVNDDVCFTSEKDMLEQVFGDCYFDEETGEYTESAQEYVDAWDGGSGIYAWGGLLETRDPVTGEWEHQDSCVGFYSLDGSAPEDEIVDLVLNLPEGIDTADVKIVYGDE